MLLRFLSSSRTTFRSALSIAGVIALIHAPVVALADETPAPSAAATSEGAARTHFLHGTELYDDGDFKLALIEFERAYELSKNYRVLYNIGQIQFQLGHYSHALRSLQRFLDEGGDAIPAERRTSTTKDIASLRKRTASLLVQSSSTGAEVAVDGEAVGQLPFRAPILVDAGEHRIVVAKAGYTSQSRVVVLAGGDAKVETVTLVQSAKVPTEPPIAEVRGSKLPAGIAWVTTGSLAAAAGVFGALWVDARGGVVDQVDTLGSTQEGRVAAANRTSVYGGIATGLGVGAVVGLGVAIYLSVRGGSTTRPTASAPLRGGFVW